MKDNEIIKALECCGKGFGNCEGCPYDNENNDCVTNDGKTLIFQDALDLINRQKAEIERYLHSIKLLENDIKTAKEEAVKEFGHFLIDEAEGGKIHTIDIPDYVQEFLGK